MSDMKCPVCNVGYVHESVNHWCCDYEFCPSYDETDTETYDILIRTRKALEIAVDMLKRIDETRSGVKENLHATNGRTLNAGNGFCWATIDDIHNALEQITALEQKDE